MRNLIAQLPQDLKDELIVRLAELLAASTVSKQRPPPCPPDIALLGALKTLTNVEVIKIPDGEDPEAWAAKVEAETAAALAKAAHH